MSYNLFAQHIALLEGLNDNIFAHGFVGVVHNRVVKVGVEFLTVRFDSGYADFCKGVG